VNQATDFIVACYGQVSPVALNDVSHTKYTDRRGFPTLSQAGPLYQTCVPWHPRLKCSNNLSPGPICKSL